MTNSNSNSNANGDIRSCVFNRSGLNRLNNERRSDTFLQQNVTAHSRFLIFSHTLQVLTYLTPSANLALLSPEHVPPFETTSIDPPLLVLGRDDHTNTPHLAVRLPLGYNPTPWLSTLPRSTGTPKFLHLRSASRTLDVAHAAMAAHARALFEFHTRHAFCGTCGSPTIPEQGGTRRRCERNIAPDAVENTMGKDKEEKESMCMGMWFPRTDPVVIMLVVDVTGESVLLGRQKRFAGGLFSCLAGFMEHGEGIDDAVRREVLEESGVQVDRVKFFGSQAWPFPYSLMLGCIAQTHHNGNTNGDNGIQVDQHELEDAQWFTRDDVRAMVDRAKHVAAGGQGSGFIVPPPTSIAGQMLLAYANEDPVTAFDQQQNGNAHGNGREHAASKI